MELKGQELKKLQAVCLELLLEVDRICRKNHIEYSIEGGTLIGAIREKGFLAWDDDADILITRHEYERFVEACKTDLNHDRFFIQDHDLDPEYPWGYSKIRMKGTSLIKIGQEDMRFQDGIFVDLFIYDNVPDGFISRRLHYAAIYFIRKCQYAVVARKTASNAFLRGWYSLLHLIPLDTVFGWLKKIRDRANQRRTELMRVYTYPYPSRIKYGHYSECFDEYTDVLFEGQVLRMMKKYDLFLRAQFGDYMTPPLPEEITHYPISSIKFPDDIDQLMNKYLPSDNIVKG